MGQTLSGTDGRRGTRVRQVGILLFAIGVGLVLALIAPADWTAGSGRVTLTYSGSTVVSEAVSIGPTDHVVYVGDAGSSEVTFTLPGGIPVDQPVRVEVGISDAGQPLRPDLKDIEVMLELSDGRQELIPLISWDANAGVTRGQLRPTSDAAVVLGLLGIVVVLWVSEVIPLFVTALLIPVVLVFTGVSNATEATAPFFNPIIVLFFAGFLMAEAMHRSGLDHWVSVSITAWAGRSPFVLFSAMISLAAFLSMWMSNTASAAVLIPIAVAVSEPLHEHGFRKVLVLGIAFASTIGGVGSAIGTPANMLAIAFLEEFGDQPISFTGWFAFGLPMVVLFIPIMGAYLWKTGRISVDAKKFEAIAQAARRERHTLGKPTRDQVVVVAVFGAVALGWITQTVHHVHPGIVALAGAVVLFALQRLIPSDLGRISWASLLTFGGGLTLGLFVVQSGVSDYLATRLGGLGDIPVPLAVLAVATLTLVMTTVASNTASAAILIPLALPLASVIGVSPVLLVCVVAIASSIDFALVIGTPPTMIAYATGLFTAGEVFRRGVLLDVIGLILLVFVVTNIWGLIGIV